MAINNPVKGLILVGGCFDVLHFGHISFLKAAKQHGTKLVVALESDENVRRMKGPKRPIHNQNRRKMMLESLKFIDIVIPLPPMHNDRDYARLVAEINPEVIAATEGDPVLAKKREHAGRVNARVVVIPRVRTPSTSQLAKLIGLER
ncbi:hypothetical protein A2Z33_03090 [Candidatus Gottesmanbacteria bacterium RBG_16_52_11]|uniref:Cytidyltransferase-like domain-containing protein n=1 Tax=Candidatus Gottesmanbacteria bacterium RBG_16_52_11 TaxID=1798374 RepID=A0A1F5YVL8_9BACT|nr:MAG: hypothetical protein A2Z33_03090 [Candidatus Gottesmanbacteria bacterium RBG_16_52_11]